MSNVPEGIRRVEPIPGREISLTNWEALEDLDCFSPLSMTHFHVITSTSYQLNFAFLQYSTEFRYQICRDFDGPSPGAISEGVRHLSREREKESRVQE